MLLSDYFYLIDLFVTHHVTVSWKLPIQSGHFCAPFMAKCLRECAKEKETLTSDSFT